MSKSRFPEIRELLAKHPDGMTSKQVHDHIGGERGAVLQSLRIMKDVYVDRWTEAKQARPSEGIFIWVPPPDEPPPDCPKPLLKGKK